VWRVCRRKCGLKLLVDAPTIDRQRFSDHGVSTAETIKGVPAIGSTSNRRTDEADVEFRPAVDCV
jgi:hypothetical protein